MNNFDLASYVQHSDAASKAEAVNVVNVLLTQPIAEAIAASRRERCECVQTNESLDGTNPVVPLISGTGLGSP